MAPKDPNNGHAPNADGVCDNCGLELDSPSGKAPCSQSPEALAAKAAADEKAAAKAEKEAPAEAEAE